MYNMINRVIAVYIRNNDVISFFLSGVDSWYVGLYSFNAVRIYQAIMNDMGTNSISNAVVSESMAST